MTSPLVDHVTRVLLLVWCYWTFDHLLTPLSTALDQVPQRSWDSASIEAAREEALGRCRTRRSASTTWLEVDEILVLRQLPSRKD
jgi:hypothetical protein